MRLLSIVAVLCIGNVALAGERGEALFAAGCFWCTESNFEHADGVKSVTSGYSGGHKANPKYEEVSSGATGHRETARVIYDPTKTTYAHLLDVFWHNVDPFDDAGKFCDKGSQYRAAIFYLDEAQKKQAEASKTAVEKRFGKKVVTEILPASTFYDAEAHHQDFYKKNDARYCAYREGCRRDERLKQLWGKDANSR